MLKSITALALSLALLGSGCATTPVVKVNGVEVSEEEKKSPSKALIAVGLIAAGVALGIAVTSGDNSEDANSREDIYNDCIRAGNPEPYCRSLVI